MSKRPLTSQERAHENERRRRLWDKEAPGYERRMGFFERRVFGSDHRQWVCSQAVGETLEVAVGTGLNLPLYPDDVRLTGLDLSPAMLDVARGRAEMLGRHVDLREGDAQDLPFPDSTFDAAVCTYSLCNIPDEALAIAEMKRVLRPGGILLLVDHIRSSVAPLFWVQRAIEFLSGRLEGEYMTRRPLEQVRTEGLRVLRSERMRAGIVERVAAVTPDHQTP
ncbi:MAG: class I SAM-dependent methyltransferase [Actinomycetota bacterium]